MTALIASSGRVDAPGDGERGLDAPGEDREPAQPQEQLARVREPDGRHDVEGHGVDVGLVEAVEDHEPGNARFIEAPGEVRERGEERRQLDGHRDRDGAADGLGRLERAALDLLAVLQRIGREVIDVDLERVRASLLDQAGVLDPGPAGSFRSTTR
jgi:hypothetical protein